MDEYKIPANVLNATLQYLQTKPYQEVVQLVQLLGQLEKIESKKK